MVEKNHITEDDLEEAIEWLHDHHCLYFLRKLGADDETIKYIKGICKSPVFVRANDVSIDSPDNAKMYDYIQVGFDGGELKEGSDPKKNYKQE